jgi:hypothetical protein
VWGWLVGQLFLVLDLCEVEEFVCFFFLVTSSQSPCSSFIPSSMLLIVSWTVWESILFVINSFPFPASTLNVSWGGFDCGGGGGCLVTVGD